MEIRIHHFFDMIRDMGNGKEIVPHPFGHSYHKVLEKIRKDPRMELKIIIDSDDTCKNCKFLENSNCLDKIDHREDFTSKEKFNNHIDKRILEVSKFSEWDTVTPERLCQMAKPYLENIEYIYDGNDLEHTMKRKENVIKGLEYYSKLHRLNL